MTTTNTQSFYSTMPNQDDHLFFDEQIQRFDADTIKNRYGDHWKNFVSNVREVTQPDGSILKEYIIEDPSLLEEMKTPSRQFDSTSSTTMGSDDDQQSSKHKFAQIKAKFEQKNIPKVMATPSVSSTNSSQIITSRQNSNQQIDDLYARHTRASNETIPINRIDNNNSIASSQNAPNSFQRAQSIGSERSKGSSFKRFDSADEADEEVRRIHRQGEELRRHKHDSSPVSSVNEISQQQQQQSRTQYEIVDEDDNPMAIDGVQDLIKMSGITAREVPQSDGTIIKEYVIDDPQLLSKFRSQQSQQSPMIPSYTQQRSSSEDAPPPPPRIPLRQPILFRQPALTNDNLPFNIRQIHVLEPQRRYEYLTTNGKRIQFIITNSDSFNGQSINDTDIRELTNAINTRLFPSSSAPFSQQPQQPPTQPQFTLPKPWHPAVDLTHRTPANRERIGSDTQSYPSNNNNPNIGFQQIQSDLTRSASYGALNQGYYIPQNQQPVIDWNATRQQNPQGQIDPTMVRQVTDQRHQNTEAFQTSAQFLPQQTTKSTHSPPLNNNPQVYYQQQQQQQPTYPYQGQQQHGVRIFQNKTYDLNSQRTDLIPDGKTRI